MTSLSQVLEGLPRRSLRTSRLLAISALVLGAVGPNLPWAGFAGFPGRMTLSFYPVASKAYLLALLPALLLVVRPTPRRRQAGLWAATGMVLLVVQTILAISDAGGGLGEVHVGAWVALVGGLCGWAAFAVLPVRGTEPVPTFRRLPAVIEAPAVAVAVAVAFVGLVYALRVDAASQFLGFVIAVAAALLALQRLGVFAWLGAVYARWQAITLILMAVAAIAFPFTQNGESYWLRVAANVGVFAAAAIGLNVVVGLAGLLDLGYIAFFGVGAYVAALYGNAGLGPSRGHIPFIFVIPLGALVSGLAGVLVGAPTLRLRGDYLAIVTLGFGEIFHILVNTYDAYTGGPNGLADIPDLKAGGFDFGKVHTVFGVHLAGFANYYFLELVLVAVTMFAFARLNASRVGRAWVAIREDELAAAATGVNTVAYKLLAFGIGATLAGASGTVQAHVATQVSPDSFVFQNSALLLAAVVLGGMGTVPGAVVGSAILIALPEKLRAFSDYRLLVFGVLLVLLMRFRPEGLIASKRRRREFQEGSASDALGETVGAPT